MYIYEMKAVTEETFRAFQTLIPQLTKASLPPSREALFEMIESAQTFIFIARHPDTQGEIVGTATLAVFQTPTGVHGWIEDVVVDQVARRQGIGEGLTRACLDKSRELGLQSVNLTSRPSREAANQLYSSMGFILRETNVYRYELK